MATKNNKKNNKPPGLSLDLDTTKPEFKVKKQIDVTEIFCVKISVEAYKQMVDVLKTLAKI